MTEPLAPSAAGPAAGIRLAQTSVRPERCGASVVFLMDESHSVAENHWKLQLTATADALTHPDVLDAIRIQGGVAVMARAFNWHDRTLLDWQMIRTEAEARDFADKLRAIAELPKRSGGTEIGRSTQNSFANFADSPCKDPSARQVVDVYTDGQQTSGPATMVAAREEAHRLGITINGLAVQPAYNQIYSSMPTAEDIRQQLQTYLVTQDGFSLATDWKDFPQAARRKFILDVAGTKPKEQQAETTLPIVPEGQDIKAPTATLPRVPTTSASLTR